MDYGFFYKLNVIGNKNNNNNINLLSVYYVPAIPDAFCHESFITQ